MSYYEISDRQRTLRTDRYRNCKILRDKETKYTLLSTRDDIEIIPKSSDFLHTITYEEEGRIDMISYNYYRTPLLWWVIAQANNIYDIFTQVVPGTVLRIPSLESLYGNNGILL